MYCFWCRLPCETYTLISLYAFNGHSLILDIGPKSQDIQVMERSPLGAKMSNLSVEIESNAADQDSYKLGDIYTVDDF